MQIRLTHIEITFRQVDRWYEFASPDRAIRMVKRDREKVAAMFARLLAGMGRKELRFGLKHIRRLAPPLSN
jgi:hypothetical protein